MEKVMSNKSRFDNNCQTAREAAAIDRLIKVTQELKQKKGAA